MRRGLEHRRAPESRSWNRDWLRRTAAGFPPPSIPTVPSAAIRTPPGTS
jgi:hypothetical protein